MRPTWIHVSLIVSLASCGSGNPENTGGDGGVDATKRDSASGGQDTGPADTGTGPDTGAADAPTDVGATDGGRDAGVADGGHDAALDAGHGDAGHPPDATSDVVKRDPCGTVLDGGGEVFGTCPHGEKCCPGGTPDSYYCYDGGGKCPALP